MKKRTKTVPALIRRILLVALYASVLKSSLANATSSSRALDDLVGRFWAWRLRESPEYGTKFGMHDNDDKLEEMTEEAFLRRKDTAGEFLAEADRLQPEDLDNNRQISLSILKHNLRAFITGYDFRQFGQFNPVSPMETPVSDWTRVLSNMKYETVEDYQKLFSRLRAIATQVDQYISLMKLGIHTGKTLHNASLTGVAGKFDLELEKNESSVFHGPLRSVPTTLPEDIRQEVWRNGSEIIQTFVFSALDRFRKFLREEYVLYTRPNVGVSSLPGGLEYYQKCLDWHLTLSMTPEEVHSTGLNEVVRLQRLMEKEMEAARFSGTLHDYISRLKSRTENFFSTEDQFLNYYQQIINETHTKIRELFKYVPDTPCIVKRNTNLQSSSGRYTAPAIDGSRPGIFWANVYNPQTKPKFNMVALTLHEAEPGHHLWSVSVRNQRNNIPEFRRFIEYRKYASIPFNFPYFTALGEGWALYAESLGEEIGAYTTPNSLFGRYASEMFRAVRLVVDTGIHAFGWSKERAIEYMANYTTQSAFSIENEVNRYISWPGQACSYKIGEMKIKELRSKAERQLGKEFNIKEFHARILGLGPAPLPVVEEQINKWIEQELPAESKATNPVNYLPALVTCVSVLYRISERFVPLQ